MISKTIGWSIFFVGIIIVLSTIYYTYNIFTGATPTPQIFNIETPEEIDLENTEGGLEGELKKMISEQLSNFIPFESLNKFANLFAWTAGAWIIINGGGKISELGIKLIRTRTSEES